MIWPNVGIRPAELGWLDRSGIDLLEWSDFQPYPLAVQCKGFKVPEEKIGQVQIDQCLKSIKSFADSDIKVKTYLLIHNRTGKNADLRTQVEEALKQLVTSGKAGKAELWDRQKLLREVFNATVDLVRKAIEEKRNNYQNEYGDRQICAPLEIIPFTQTELVADPNRLIASSKPISYLADPVSELLNADGSNLSLMIGEAGYGKTTAVLRTFTDTDHLVYYVPAPTIPSQVNTTTDLLRHCVKSQELFEEPPNEDQGVFDRLFNTAIRYLFRESSLPVTLLIDGLDESIYFSQRGGLQSLFNQLREFRFPVVLTARKEFWAQRQQDFSELFGFSRKPGENQIRRIRLIELLEWNSRQIGDLARRYQVALAEKRQRDNLQGFIDIVDSDGYEKYYGDIPKRPLFLRFILETVADVGIHYTGKARLYYEWAENKIRRDIQRPMKWGDIGRQPIISDTESPDETLRLSFSRDDVSFRTNDQSQRK